MSNLGVIGSVARRQHGLVTAAQVFGAGTTRSQLRGLVLKGWLVPLRRGVYRLSGAPVTWPQAVLAAVLASGDGAVASHSTAGALWDLTPIQRHGGGLHVTVARRARVRGVSIHVRPLGAHERRTRDGIRVTSVERTIMDMAGLLTATELGQCVDDALRRRLMGLEGLRRLVDRSAGPGRRAVRPLRQVLADRLPGYDPGDSDWERNMDRVWDELGLPPALRQYPVTANGHRYVLDRALPDLKIGIEWNGFAIHGSRSAFDHDSNRRADLTAAGWHMVDFTSRSGRARLVAAVQGAVCSRAGGTAHFSDT